MLQVASSSLLLHRLASNYGWHRAFQAVAALSSISALLSTAFRPAALYHPQRDAILQLETFAHVIKVQPTVKSIAASMLSLFSSPKLLILLLSSVTATPLLLPFFLLPLVARYLAVPEPVILVLQMTLGLASSLGSILAGSLFASFGSHRLASRLLCQASLLLSASTFLSCTLLPPRLSSYPPVLLLASFLYGLSWGAYQTSRRILLWRCLRSRFLLAESVLQASQAAPLLLLLYLSSVEPLLTAFASTASLVLSLLLLFLLPRDEKGKVKEKRGNTAKREEKKEEEVLNNVCQKGSTSHEDSHHRVITSCNKVFSITQTRS